MFSGIITHTGKIKKIYKKNNNCIFEIESRIKFKKNDLGSSVSCSGTCLTLEKYRRNISKFYLSKETLKRTIFKTSKVGDIINLEKPIKFGSPVSGHFVQGHVDTTAYVNKIEIVGAGISKQESQEFMIIENKDIKVGIISIADDEFNEWTNVNKWMCENGHAVGYHGQNKEDVHGAHMANRKLLLERDGVKYEEYS